MAETSVHSSRSSVNQTSSTAVQDTDVQFLNDSAIVGTRASQCRVDVGTKPSHSRARRPRTHRVSVTVPTDTTRDKASSRAVTFQHVEPSVSSRVDGVADAQHNDDVLPTADRGEQTLCYIYAYF